MLGEKHPAPAKSSHLGPQVVGADAGTGTKGDMLRFWGETLLSQGNSRVGECPMWESQMWAERVEVLQQY